VIYRSSWCEIPGVGTLVKSADIPSPEIVDMWGSYYGEAVLIQIRKPNLRSLEWSCGRRWSVNSREGGNGMVIKACSVLDDIHFVMSIS